MIAEKLSRPIGKGVIFGAIGGFVGGLMMYAVMSGVMQAIGMGANCFAVILALITGQPFSNSLVPIGFAIHLITSTVIGAIFGVVISSINKLRIKKFARGIGFGVATGLIAFVIIFVPVAMFAMPPKMMDLMKMMNSQMMMSPGGANTGDSGMNEKSTMNGNTGMNAKSGMMSSNNNMPRINAGEMEGKSTTTSGKGMKSEMNSDQMMMSQLSKMQSMIIGGSLLSHIVYGAVLGAVVTVLIIKATGTSKRGVIAN